MIFAVTLPSTGKLHIPIHRTTRRKELVCAVHSINIIRSYFNLDEWAICMCWCLRTTQRDSKKITYCTHKIYVCFIDSYKTKAPAHTENLSNRSFRWVKRRRIAVCQPTRYLLMLCIWVYSIKKEKFVNREKERKSKRGKEQPRENSTSSLKCTFKVEFNKRVVSSCKFFVRFFMPFTCLACYICSFSHFFGPILSIHHLRNVREEWVKKENIIIKRQKKHFYL